MKEYQPFAISNFRTGFNESVEPWLLPRDSFQVFKNAHLYRGVVEKVSGYELYARMSYRQQKEVALTGVIDGANKTFTATLSPVPNTASLIVQATINAGATQREIFTDTGSGLLLSNLGGVGTVNYVTGALTVTFNTAPVKLPGGGNVYNTVLVQWDSAPLVSRSIMGIKPYYAANGDQQILVFDTRRVGKVVSLTGGQVAIQGCNYAIQEIPHEVQALSPPTPAFSAGPVTFTGTIGTNLVPGEVHFFRYNVAGAIQETITDNGAGLLTGTGLTTGYINYSTGAWTITFAAAPVATDTLQTAYCIYGDVFTGDFTNFFSVANYKNFAFITNSIDQIRYYDGMCLLFLNTNLIAAAPPVPNTFAITRALHVYVYRERLLLLAPYVSGSPQLNTIYWSAVGDPLDFTLANNAGFLPATTSESIKAIGQINTDLVVRFSDSERVFRYTGDAFAPFRWDSTNDLWRCDASFSAINYDSYFTSVGKPAIVGSDGVNVTRVDEIIPDFTLNSRIPDQQPVITIDQTSIGQCYGERFDDFKEGWLCFKNSDGPDDVNVVQPSDSILAFNYLDNTYAVYTFPFSVLGFGTIINNLTWGTDEETWGEADDTWDSYYQDSGALVDLAGGHDGFVYQLGSSNDMGLSGNPVLMEAVTKNFNPFVEDGQLARLGYVDLFFSSNADTKLRVQFYKDDYLDANYTSYYQETILTLPGTGRSKIWKRIYVGAVGQEHTMRFYQVAGDFAAGDPNQPVRIHAMVLYMKPAGRIFN